MPKARILWTLGLICILGSVAGVLLAQGPRPAQPADSLLNDLLTEVRGLRADIGRVSNASLRTQLLTARLQLQEQRVLTAGRQLTDVQTLLAAVRKEIVEGQNAIERLENAFGALEKIDDKNPLRGEAERQKIAMDLARQREQELRRQETELFNAVNAEQTRWTEFNGRLDEIERSLAAAAR